MVEKEQRTSNFLEEALEEYADMVYRLAYARVRNKYDADDILQDVFLRLFDNQKKIKDQEHLKAWLIRVTINCSTSLLNSSWKKKNRSLSEIDAETLPVYPTEKSYIYYAVLDLPLIERTIIHLFYYQDYKSQEIADLLKMKDSTVRSHLHRARKSLKEKLKGVDFDV